jgi:hypothetical protein
MNHPPSTPSARSPYGTIGVAWGFLSRRDFSPKASRRTVYGTSTDGTQCKSDHLTRFVPPCPRHPTHKPMPPLVLTSTQKSSSRRMYHAKTLTAGGTTRRKPLLPLVDRSDSLRSRIERRTASDIRQALTALKRRGRLRIRLAVEKIGIPLAFCCRETMQPPGARVGRRTG